MTSAFYVPAARLLERAGGRQRLALQRRSAGAGRLQPVHAYPLRLEALDRATDDLTPARAEYSTPGSVKASTSPTGGAGRASGGAVSTCSERAVRTARGRYPDASLRQADLRSPRRSGDSGRYDVVTAIDVLYHVVDDAAWARRDRPSPARWWPRAGLRSSRTSFPPREHHQLRQHVRRRALHVWAEALARHGLEVVRRVPVFVLMDDPITFGSHRVLGRAARLQWRLAPS